MMYSVLFHGILWAKMLSYKKTVNQIQKRINQIVNCPACDTDSQVDTSRRFNRAPTRGKLQAPKLVEILHSIIKKGFLCDYC